MTECRRIAVYCGASFGNDGVYAQEASKLGQLLVEYDITLVYGGGRVGLMGTIADSVMANGGKVIGVIPEFPDQGNCPSTPDGAAYCAVDARA